MKSDIVLAPLVMSGLSTTIKPSLNGTLDDAVWIFWVRRDTNALFCVSKGIGLKYNSQSYTTNEAYSGTRSLHFLSFSPNFLTIAKEEEEEEKKPTQ